MGIIISRFRKKATTKELLEQIEVELEEIDEFRFSTQQYQKRLVGRLIIISVITYLIFALLFFLYFFPSEISKQILYSLPLFIFPLIVFALKWMLHWYYAYRLSQTADQMAYLQRKKKKILKEVMSKETYVVAKEILEKYDPDRIRERVGICSSMSPDLQSVSKSSDHDLRRRSVPVRLLPVQQIKPQQINPQLLESRSITPPPPPVRPGYNAPPVQQSLYPRNLGVRPSGVPLPCPILPRQRGVFDRLVEYVVGDGPNNRYALICRQCQSHNGMALREEFEYVGFRCCYCFILNPARKQRPLPPKFPSAAELLSQKRASVDKTSFEESPTEGTCDEGPQSKHSEQTEGQTETIDLSETTLDAEKEIVTDDIQEIKKELIVSDEISPESNEPLQGDSCVEQLSNKINIIEEDTTIVNEITDLPLAEAVTKELDCEEKLDG